MVIPKIRFNARQKRLTVAALKKLAEQNNYPFSEEVESRLKFFHHKYYVIGNLKLANKVVMCSYTTPAIVPLLPEYYYPFTNLKNKRSFFALITYLIIIYLLIYFLIGVYNQSIYGNFISIIVILLVYALFYLAYHGGIARRNNIARFDTNIFLTSDVMSEIEKELKMKTAFIFYDVNKKPEAMKLIANKFKSINKKSKFLDLDGIGDGVLLFGKADPRSKLNLGLDTVVIDVNQVYLHDYFILASVRSKTQVYQKYSIFNLDDHYNDQNYNLALEKIKEFIRY